MFSNFDRGLSYRFDYPSANYVGARKRMERRRLLIETVRDTSLEPIEQEAIDRDPQLQRGRLLVTGIDLDKMARRSFYLESMRDIGYDEPTKQHRVYLFDPSGEVPPFVAYASDDLGEALAWIERWERDPNGHSAVLWPVGAAPPASESLTTK